MHPMHSPWPHHGITPAEFPIEDFRTLVADVPWPYKDKLTMRGGKVKRSADSQYRTMPLSQIADFMRATGLEERIAPRAFLWFWITTPYLLEGAHLRILDGWGFTPRTMLTWVKGRLEVTVTNATDAERKVEARLTGRLGLGHYLRGTTEHCILATRGQVKSLMLRKNGRSELVAPTGAHSQKPASFLDLVETLTPGPYLELFARERRAGWTQHGDQLPPQVDVVSPPIHTDDVTEEAPAA
jgi:N6-adenosine-specific RNA methylase IME4